MTSSKNVLVIGAVGIDRILRPLKPIPQGGKGATRVVETAGYFAVNVSLHLRNEGIVPTLITALGSDANATRLERFLTHRGINICAARLRGRNTPSSYILVGDRDRTIYRTEDSAADVWTETNFPWCLLSQKGYGWVLLGHLSGDQEGHMTRRIIRTANENGIPVSWTPGYTQYRLGVEVFADVLPQVRLLVLNREEGAAWLCLSPEATPEEVALALAARSLGRAIIAVTNGGNSPSACVAPKQPYLFSVPPARVKTVDTTGAGDAFHAGLAVALIHGRPLRDALELARRTATATCSFWGGASPRTAAGTSRSVPLEAIREVEFCASYR